MRQANFTITNLALALWGQILGLFLATAAPTEVARYQDALEDCALALEKNKDEAQVCALRSRVYAALFDFAELEKILLPPVT
jgi:hypothetical protein